MPLEKFQFFPFFLYNTSTCASMLPKHLHKYNTWSLVSYKKIDPIWKTQLVAQKKPWQNLHKIFPCLISWAMVLSVILFGAYRRVKLKYCIEKWIYIVCLKKMVKCITVEDRQKSMGTRQENLFFHIRGLRVKCMFFGGQGEGQRVVSEVGYQEVYQRQGKRAGVVGVGGMLCNSSH